MRMVDISASELAQGDIIIDGAKRTAVSNVTHNPPGCRGHAHVNFDPSPDGNGTSGDCYSHLSILTIVRTNPDAALPMNWSTQNVA